MQQFNYKLLEMYPGGEKNARKMVVLTCLINSKYFVFSGEHVFLDYSTTSLVSNQIISSGATKKCELIL